MGPAALWAGAVAGAGAPPPTPGVTIPVPGGMVACSSPISLLQADSNTPAATHTTNNQPWGKRILSPVARMLLQKLGHETGRMQGAPSGGPRSDGDQGRSQRRPVTADIRLLISSGFTRGCAKPAARDRSRYNLSL